MLTHEIPRDREAVIRSLLRAWVRMALVLTAAVAYTMGFAPLYGAWGGGVIALSLLPVAAAGFLLGLRAGLLLGLLSLPLNALLLHLAGLPGWEVLALEHGPGPLNVVVIGAIAGWLRELLARIQAQSHQLVTERAALQEQMAARQRVEDAQRAIEHTLLATQKVESLGLLAGGVAHDFNNLLMAVLGNAALVLRELPPDAPARESVERIAVVAQRAADLTQQLLVYAGKSECRVEVLNVGNLVTEMTQLLRASIPKHVTLCYELASQLPAVLADPIQLRQVIMNLILNAADAIGSQTGEITVGTDVRNLNAADLASPYLATELPPGVYVALAVVDTGCGMDAATIAKICDPFFTTKVAGRGLGLAAVLGIVRSHQGALQVQSEAGRGTTVTVLLPCAAGLEMDARAGASEDSAGLAQLADSDMRGIQRTTVHAHAHPTRPRGLTRGV